MSHPDGILIIDFGSQFTQLIARRIREQRVYCEIHPPSRDVAWISDWRPKGVILSGGPNSVYGEGVPTAQSGAAGNGRSRARPLLWDAGVGAARRRTGGARVAARVRPRRREDRRREALRGFATGATTPVWMSHGDHVDEAPPGWHVTASTARTRRSRRSSTTACCSYAVQFHPEVAHTPRGGEIPGELSLRDLRLQADLDAGTFHPE